MAQQSTSNLIQNLKLPESVSLLEKIHEQFHRRRQELLQERHEWIKKNRSQFELTQPGSTNQVRSAQWNTEFQSSSTDVSLINQHSSFVAFNQWKSTQISPNLILDFEDTGIISITQQGVLLDHFMSEGRFIRIRNLLMDEKSLQINGRTVSAGHFDLTVAFSQGAPRGIVIPKIESSLEARYWADVLNEFEKIKGLPRASVPVCIEIETVRAVTEVHEIIFELKDRAIALRWDARDYAWSWIKQFSTHPDLELPSLLSTEEREAAFGELREYLKITAAERKLIFLMQEQVLTLQKKEPSFFVRPPQFLAPAKPQVSQAIHFCLEYLDYWLFGDQHGEHSQTLNQKDLADFELTRSLLWHWLHKNVILLEAYTEIKDRWVGSTQGAGDTAARLLDTLILNSSLAEYTEPMIWSAYRKLQGAQTSGNS